MIGTVVTLAAIASLGEDSQLATAIQDALAETRCHVVWQVGTPFDGIDGAWQAPNRPNGLRTYFLLDGPHVVARTAAGGDWSYSLTLRTVARGARECSPEEPVLEAQETRVQYDRGAITEWYVNDERGVEQGFDITSRPLAGSLECGAMPNEPLELRLELGGTWTVENSQRVSLYSGTGGHVLTLSGLFAHDAVGRELDCWFARRGDALALVVDDRAAEYPIVVDPLITGEEALLASEEPTLYDNFGTSVDLDGDLALVGAPGRSATAGVAYVFRKTTSGWMLETKLIPPQAQPGESFGWSTCIVGPSEVLIGAPNRDSTFQDCGAVYSFLRGAEGWELAEIVEPPVPYRWYSGGFGWSLDSASGYFIGGAPGDDGSAAIDSGVVHVFVRTAGGWEYEQYVKVFQEIEDARGGWSVDMPGPELRFATGGPGFETGHTGQGAVAIYEHDGNRFEKTAVLTSPGTGRFGHDVALSGHQLLVGAPATVGTDGSESAGAVCAFSKIVDTWLPTATFGQSGEYTRYGWSIDIHTDAEHGVQALVGAPGADGVGFNAGVVDRYQYVLSWSFEERIESTDWRELDFFGTSVVLDGGVALVGGSGASYGGRRHGSVQTFALVGGNWTADELLGGVDLEPGGRFATAVDIAGNLAVVGAPGDSDELERAGAAYVFERENGIWRATAKLALGGGLGVKAGLGGSISTDGTTIAVGAPFEQTVAVYERTPSGGWYATLLSIPGANGAFGHAVEVHGDFLAIGRPATIEAGDHWVFQRAGSGDWRQLVPDFPPTASGDRRGAALALRGNDLFVAAPGYPRGPQRTGEVYHYRFAADVGTFVLQRRMSELLPTPELTFGTDVAFAGEHVAISAIDESSNTASVHVFMADGSSWAHETALRPTGSGPLESEGLALDMDSGRIAVGDVGADEGLGAAWVYQRVGSLWEETIMHTQARDPLDDFGLDVAVSGDRALIGAPGFDALGLREGAALMFRFPRPEPIQSFGYGDGSAGPCPCGNESVPGKNQGCQNSTGAGARLHHQGTASVVKDDLILRAHNLPPYKSALLLVSEAGIPGLPFGDGLRFVGTPLKRLKLRHANAAGAAAWANLHSLGLWEAGDTRIFQVVYRDLQGPCGKSFNLTNAMQVVFLP